MLTLLMGLIGLAQTADAACNTPAGAPGDMTYSTSANVMVYCDGSNWISMAGGVSLTVNTSGGGGATPYGASGDVQINSSGALGGDTGNFKYTASTLYAPNLNISGNVTASTVNASGLGTFGSILDNGGLTVLGAASMTTVSASTISSTLLQLVSNSSAACTSSLAGAQRYNSVSNTIDYCSGSAWLSLGPSATVVPSFSVNKGGTNQTGLANNSTTKLTWSNVRFDTTNSFASNKYTPSIPGKYFITLSIRCTNAVNTCAPVIFKNGAGIGENATAASSTPDMGATTNVIVDMNGTTDYLEAYVYAGGTSNGIYGNALDTRFEGFLITMGGGGAGGTATPAGSTGDVQINTSGALDADTGLFYYDKTNHRLGIGTNTPAAALHVSGSIYVSNSDMRFDNGKGFVSAAGARLATGAIGNTWQVYGTGVGNLFGWANASGTTLGVINQSGYLGIGNVAPSATLDVNGEIKVGNTGLACSNAVSGSVRYNSTSNTIDYCTGTSWTSLGPSSTVPSFAVNRNGTNQTVTANTATKILFTTVEFDTNSNFNTGTSRFTPNVAGTYIFELNAYCTDNANWCQARIYKNGAEVVESGQLTATNASHIAHTTAILRMNGTTDYVEGYVYNGGGTTLSGAVVDTRFAGTMVGGAGGSGGGTATPAGSTADVQFNTSGALDADTTSFTYTKASGLLKAPNISATAIQATGLGTFGSALINGGVTATGQASLTIISSTLLQLVSNTTTACTSSLAGSQRYNSVSNTIDYCSGSAWLSLGPSATLVPAFYVTRGNVDQTVTANTPTLISFNTKTFDTNNNFNTATSRFQPTIPGKYVVSTQIWCSNGTASGCYVILQKNGTNIAQQNVYTATAMPAVSQVVDMNGTTDYLTVLGANIGATTISGLPYTTYFTGSLITMAGSGSGGTATPAGSTNDIQFNTSGALDADTGLFTYTKATGNLSATTISTTVVNIASVSTIANVVGGGGNIISSGSTAVSTSSAGSITFYAGGGRRAFIDSTGLNISDTVAASRFFMNPTSYGYGTGAYFGSSSAGSTGLSIDLSAASGGYAQLQAIQSSGSAWGSLVLNPSGGSVLAGMSTAYTDGVIGLSPLQANAKTSGHAGITVKVESGAASTPMIGFANSNGTVGTISTNGSATAYNTSSDRRLKENIVTTREGLQKLMSIGVMDFNFRKDPSKTVVQGFIAQDLNKIYPEAVTVGDDGKDVKKQWQVDYGRITPLIVKAVQDLNTKTDGAVKSLKADNENLRAALNAANDNIAELRKEVDALRRAR